MAIATERKGRVKIGDLTESKYLKKEDCGKGILVTIAGLEEAVIKKEDGEEHVRVLLFRENVKPMVLKSTNTQLINTIMGTTNEDDTDDWNGKQIVLFHDPNVTMKGKVVGGIRARAPRVTARPPAKAAPAPVEAEPFPAEGDDDIPF